MVDSAEKVLYSQWLRTLCIRYIHAHDESRQASASSKAERYWSTCSNMLSLEELNELALDRLVYEPISSQMLEHVASKAIEVVKCEELTKGPTSLKGGLPPLPPLKSFITSLVCKSTIQVVPVMSCLVYLDRLKQNLPPNATGGRCTAHRIFFATLILATKFLNDSPPKNKQWSNYSYVQAYKDFGFSLAEVNLMEKQLLYLLDWKLMVSRKDIRYYSEPFLAPIRQEILEAAVSPY